ncbi:polyprenol monophosphomannose synthase [Candidatus Magnetominusculus xianensis]|uniref:Dolichol-phosphate mannosyltransferase n=1 Tax=Candidatus Magnetominusculus xianensis TaxID=1748249 RepID=A0ABR5SD04_9BACT|nr:polyprenol monophosphomannose synthase [Candidatus Magnetominusculus xianensis]KWT75632.1 dolichol-phosphate mannosyltransferase [Candidatus Magnetominusculus xianensis]MBF0403715.1 polyprenol monophosphomannose synthase [Nitrospirota bacterium]
MEKNEVLIFTATYNEKYNIKALCEQIYSVSPDYDILVVDDNSPDGTGELLDKLREDNSRLKVIHRPRKLGLGSAHKLGILYAVINKYRYVVTMDADYSHNPDDIPRLLKQMEGYDFVIGSRYVKGGNCSYSGYRKYLSRCANLLAKLLLKIPLHEFTTSFRVFRVSKLEKLSLASIKSQGYAFFMESLFRLYQQGFSIAEVPIVFNDRTLGESKIPKYEILRGIYTLFRLFANKRISHIKEITPIYRTCPLCASPYLIGQGDRMNSCAWHCLLCGLSFTAAADREIIDV